MGQNLLDSDNFNTGSPTNGTSLHSYNSDWTSPASSGANTASIQGGPSNYGAGGAATAEIDAIRTGFTWTNDQWAQATLDGTTLPIIAMICLRHDTSGSGTAGSGYAAGLDNSDFNGFYNICTLTNNALTRIAAGETTVTAVVGDVVNFQVVGSTLTLKVNGTIIATCTDTTYTAGDPGLLGFRVGAGPIFHAWQAGSVGGAIVIPTALLHESGRYV